MGLSVEARELAIASLDLDGRAFLPFDLQLVKEDESARAVSYRLVEVDADGEAAWIWLTVDVPGELDDVTQAAVAVGAAAPVIAALQLAAEQRGF